MYITITQNHSISFWPFSSPQGECEEGWQHTPWISIAAAIFHFILYAFSFYGVYRLEKITLNWIGPVHSFKHYFSLFKLIVSTVGGAGEGGLESLLFNFSSEIRFTKGTQGILFNAYWECRGKFWTSLRAWIMMMIILMMMLVNCCWIRKATYSYWHSASNSSKVTQQKSACWRWLENQITVSLKWLTSKIDSNKHCLLYILNT